MDDKEIIALYNSRDEKAISATEGKYGRLCRSLALNILSDGEEAEECVNDALLSAWNAIPPAGPLSLGAFVCRITRNHAFDRLRKNRAARRGGGRTEAILSELEECVSGGGTEQEADRRELAAAISEFLRGLPADRRGIFVRRYWYCDSLSDISRRYGMKAGSVAVTLQRLREKLRVFLTERGFEV